MEEPTATHSVLVGQSTEPNAPKDVGNVGTDHVVPPSDERSSSPAKGPLELGVTPTLTQRVVVGQVTPSNVVLLVGTVDDVHVLPPSVERTVAPLPTATHTNVFRQSTALSSGSSASSSPWVQVPPPFVDVELTAPRLPSPPTATQSVAVGQDTALKLPAPLVAPPGAGTTGVLLWSCGVIQWIAFAGGDEGDALEIDGCER
jgi:hypothetical protein